VPADRAAESEAELDGVLAALADTQQSCADMIAAAERDAAAIRARAATEAETLVRQARDARQSVRADAAAQVGDPVKDDVTRLLSTADDRASAERARAEQRIPDLVARAVADVQAMAGGTAPHTPHRPGTTP